ncbi:hypothetical protein [Mycobacterium parmense]|uniref:Uncharacterized protein n=1 Tax=Mycobacterium parmense TaxID=185642 RepID=A0A7I7YXI2_9MYCO|nr:hypothetical protein [Mycobacterium parmense]MCV7350556.1 hypothetical protein [Mycobacterium parmense]ORW48272.1 hypothetical protein AWC20_25345 [Mycobacterium parmense]BBZ46017.1 hypothetical protein MPRM_32980 [Mycobacterium parmense]
MIRSQTALGAAGGLVAGYLLWLAAFSIVDDNAAVGRWAPTVLLLSVVLGIAAAVGGLMLRRRGRHAWSALAFGLPVLPVALTLAVLADVYF